MKKSEEDSSDGDSHVKTFSASETPILKEPKRSKQAQENASQETFAKYEIYDGAILSFL